MLGKYTNKALAEVASESWTPKELRGNMTIHRAILRNTNEGYCINAAMSLQRSVLVLDPIILDKSIYFVVVAAPMHRMLEGCLQGALCILAYSAVVTMFSGTMLHSCRAEFDLTQSLQLGVYYIYKANNDNKVDVFVEVNVAWCFDVGSLCTLVTCFKSFGSELLTSALRTMPPTYEGMSC